MMALKHLCCISFALFFLGTGCAFMGRGEVSEIVYHDLSTLKEEQVVSPPAEFRVFSDITGNGIRPVTRLGDGSVSLGENHRFSGSPVQLIRRRLTELFPPASPEATLKISGTLYRFELDSGKNQAMLGIDYLLTYKKCRTVQRHRIGVKIAGEGQNAGFTALEKCIIRSARRLGEESSNFVKQCESKNK